MKAVTKIFHNGTDKNILAFSFRKVSTKRYNEMDAKSRKRAIEFIRDCEDSLWQFKENLKLNK